MKMGEALKLELSAWEAEIAASAFVQGAGADEIAIIGPSRMRVAGALHALRSLPRRRAAQIALEALIIAEEP